MESVVERLRRGGYEAFHWSGRDGTFNDLSVNKNNGTVVSGVSIQKSENGMSGQFDGAGRIDIGSAAVLLPNAFSLVIWDKHDITTFRPSFGWENAGANYYPCVMCSWSSSRPQMYLGANNFRNWVSPTQDGGWHFYAFTIPGSAQVDINSAACYYDAAPLTVNATDATGAQAAKVYARIGASIGGGANRFVGRMDTVILYSGYVLNSTEVSQLYGETHPRGIK